jgi:hypothetical protein
MCVDSVSQKRGIDISDGSPVWCERKYGQQLDSSGKGDKEFSA